MVPPEEMAVAGVKARETETEVLPTMRSEEAMVNETDETRVKTPPDDTAFEIEHAFARNLTSTAPAVAAPIVNPLIVTVNADAGMAAPDVVIVTAVAEVAPHVAVKPATLLAPEATEGTTEDAKKLEGYDNVKALPDRMECEGVKPRVMKTDDLPGTLSADEIMKVNEEKSLQKKTFQRDFDVKEETETGVLRCVVLPSPTCTRKQNTSSATKTSLPAPPPHHATASLKNKTPSITWP